MKTRTQLLLWLLLALLIMVVVVAGIQTTITYQQTSSATMNLLEHQAAALAFQTQIWFERVGQSARFLTRQMSGKPGRGVEAEKVLANFYHTEEGVDSLVVADDMGNILSLYPTNKSQAMKGVAREGYFLDTIIAQEPRTSIVIPSPLTGKATVAFTQPVTLTEGPGILIVYLNLDFLTDMSKAYWVGKTGYSVIFNGHGQDLSIATVEKTVSEKLLHRFFMDQRSGVASDTEFYAVARVPGPGWGAAVLLPQKEVWQSVAEGIPYVAAVFILVFLLLAAGSTWLIEYWVRPLNYLTKQVGSITNGQFPQGILTERQFRGATREIRELAKKFVSMTTDLQLYIVALKDANLALEKKEERWRLALAGSSVGVWDWDMVGEQIFFSSQAKRLFGYEDYEIENTLVAWREKAHPDDRLRLKDTIDAHLKGESEVYQVEYRFLCKDGSYRWAMAMGRLLRHDDGTPLRMAGSISDVTDRHHYEMVLQKANQQLEGKVEERTQELMAMNEELQAINSELQNMNVQMEQEIDVRIRVEAELSQTMENLRETQEELIQKEKLASLSGLVAGVAHEVNTPVGVAVTAASYLEQVLQQLTIEYRAKSLTARQMEVHLEDSGEAIRLLSSNLQKAAALIRSFKQVVTDQSSDLQRVIFLNEYLNEVISILHSDLKKTLHTIKLDIAEDIQIYSYPGALAKVISNLVYNSLQHAYDVGQHGNITITARVENDMFVLIYQDDGKGITEEIRRRIFEPFFTTQRGRGGLGLGLYNVYNTVQQVLGGKIECASNVSKGITFIIRVPIGAGITTNPLAKSSI